MSKKKQPARRRATRRTTRSFEAMARAAVARTPLILVDVTDILTAKQEAALIEAYIDQQCADDCKAEFRAKAKADAGRDDTSADIVWIKEEIAFALGLEVGRRLAGDYLRKVGRDAE